METYRETFLEKDVIESTHKKNVVAFPDSLRGIKTGYSLGGSSDVTAGYYEGELFVVKKAREPRFWSRTSKTQYQDQIKEEYIADNVYEALGFAVPKSRIYENGGVKLSKFIDGKDLGALKDDRALRSAAIQELKKGFVLDCLLANWDVVGTNEDNIRLSTDGGVYRIDNGGALRFRARGELKGVAFGDEVGELETLRVQNNIYADITDEEIQQQIAAVLEQKRKIYETIERSAWEAGLTAASENGLINAISKRLRYLEKWLALKKVVKATKGEYESIVTNNYFEGWEELILSGNKSLKDELKKNIIEVETQQADDYRRSAAAEGLSEEEFKAALQEKVERVVAQSNFFRATDVGVVEKIMSIDGRWMSQFETRKSHGSLDPEFRALAEKKMFGFPNDPNQLKELRPIYGYFSDGENGEINYDGHRLLPTSVWHYGSVNFKIKKNVALKKATVSFHDTLDSKFLPTPAAKPHFISIDIRNVRPGFLANFKHSKIANYGDIYNEAQFHGQLTMDDVESIHISTKNLMSREDMQRVREAYGQYMKNHPKSALKLIEY